MTGTLEDRLRELDNQRLESEPRCIGRRADYDADVITDATGAIVGTYRDLLSHARDRDYTPEGPIHDYQGAVMVLHPAAMRTTEDAGTFAALAKRFNTPVHVVQIGSRWWFVFVGAPVGDVYNEHEGRCWFRVMPDGGVHMEAAS